MLRDNGYRKIEAGKELKGLVFRARAVDLGINRMKPVKLKVLSVSNVAGEIISLEFVVALQTKEEQETPRATRACQISKKRFID